MRLQAKGFFGNMHYKFSALSNLVVGTKRFPLLQGPDYRRAYPQRYPGAMMSRSAAWLGSISVQLFANSFGDFIPSELCG